MNRFVLASTLLLAACGSAGEDSEANVSVAVPEPSPSPSPEPVPTPEETPEPEASATEAAAATGPTDAIPAEWRGIWAGRDGCARSATMRVRVAADRLVFYESEGVASEIERRAPREIALKLAMSGEGETWERRAVLSLSADGERLTRTEAGMEPVTYTRCAV
ncbi:hypothetical protein COC42_05280 [Sphingomonas spermidinifaciens]|uniref:Uncharacterized protein n=1 Tax=Sphingomonas spermidinifaciens TaxID=1141889 RepID=A0A2A4B7K4_9SPHN|nr:hypothetical protein [Sphingomonas spermidinifaciens]PCD03759.1 hypothetical protein COC42_05280 [Sphingomonas spermidinifaciens]